MNHIIQSQQTEMSIEQHMMYKVDSIVNLSVIHVNWQLIHRRINPIRENFIDTKYNLAVIWRIM